MISKWVRRLRKMQKPYRSFAWNEKHVQFAFSINIVQLLGLSTTVSRYQTCQRCMCLPVTDLQSRGRCEAGGEQQLGGLRHGLWVRVRISRAQRVLITWGTGSATSGAAHDTAGAWVVFTGSLCRARLQCPKQIHVPACEEGSVV